MTGFFSSAYLGPVSYFREMFLSEDVFVDIYEYYVKQTYRNRCRILTANGVMDLVVPVQRSGSKMPMKDVRISYKEDWQKLHWRAIESAYSSTPFFEYYRDSLEPIFMHREEFLLDLSQKLTTQVFSLINIEKIINYTDEYKSVFEFGETDFRMAFSPKSVSESRVVKPYYQVFSDRFSFVDDLSVIDLIFNMGPEAIFTLNNREI